MTDNQKKNEFSRIFNLSQIGKSGVEITLATNDVECVKLAERFSIFKIESVVANCFMKKLSQKDHGDYRLIIELTADVIQKCVLTLVDINESINEKFNIIFQITPSNEDENQSAVIDFAVDDEDMEIIKDTEIDLGKYIAEYLSLFLDPYPRIDQAKGNELGYKIFGEDEISDESEKKNPFNVLKSLKHKT